MITHDRNGKNGQVEPASWFAKLARVADIGRQGAPGRRMEAKAVKPKGLRAVIDITGIRAVLPDFRALVRVQRVGSPDVAFFGAKAQRQTGDARCSAVLGRGEGPT